MAVRGKLTFFLLCKKMNVFENNGKWGTVFVKQEYPPGTFWVLPEMGIFWERKW